MQGSSPASDVDRPCQATLETGGPTRRAHWWHEQHWGTLRGKTGRPDSALAKASHAVKSNFEQECSCDRPGSKCTHAPCPIMQVNLAFSRLGIGCQSRMVHSAASSHGWNYTKQVRVNRSAAHQEDRHRGRPSSHVPPGRCPPSPATTHAAAGGLSRCVCPAAPCGKSGYRRQSKPR